MNNTLKYIIERWNLNINPKAILPIEIPEEVRGVLPILFKELGFTVGAEIGVLDGVFAEKLCLGNPELKLYCVDPWECLDGYNDYSSESLTRCYLTAKEKLSPYNCEIVKKTSMDAVKDFEDGSLDFVYLDGAHDFKNVAMDLCEWIKKIKIGGILCGHDFRRYVLDDGEVTPKHVVEALAGFTVAYHIRPWFVLGKRSDPKGVKRDKERSWMIVKNF